MNVERLTKYGYQFSLLNVLQGLTRYTEIDEILNQLAAYEDTGLSPADIPALTARAEAAEADLRKCAPCWLCKKKCGIFDALDQRKDGCCPNFEYRGSQAGKGAAPNE